VLNLKAAVRVRPQNQMKLAPEDHEQHLQPKRAVPRLPINQNFAWVNPGCRPSAAAEHRQKSRTGYSVATSSKGRGADLTTFGQVQTVSRLNVLGDQHLNFRERI
jgi:hypothetical protein